MTLIHPERLLETTQMLYKSLDLYKLTYTIFLPICLDAGNLPNAIL